MNPRGRKRKEFQSADEVFGQEVDEAQDLEDRQGKKIKLDDELNDWELEFSESDESDDSDDEFIQVAAGVSESSPQQSPIARVSVDPLVELQDEVSSLSHVSSASSAVVMPRPRSSVLISSLEEEVGLDNDLPDVSVLQLNSPAQQEALVGGILDDVSNKMCELATKLKSRPGALKRISSGGVLEPIDDEQKSGSEESFLPFVSAAPLADADVGSHSEEAGNNPLSHSALPVRPLVKASVVETKDPTIAYMLSQRRPYLDFLSPPASPLASPDSSSPLFGGFFRNSRLPSFFRNCFAPSPQPTSPVSDNEPVSAATDDVAAMLRLVHGP